MSQPNVTITLGRSGQVVRRRGSALQNPRSGKRSRVARDDSDHPLSTNKRRRGDDFHLNSGSPVAKNDLRLKLMRKRRVQELQKKEQHENLQKAIHRPSSAVMPHRKLLQKETSFLTPNPSQGISDKETSFLTPNPSQGISDNYFSEGLRREYQSSISLEGTSKGLLPLRSFSEVQRIPGIRPAGISGVVPLVSNEVVTTSKPVAPRIMKPVTPAGAIMPQSLQMAVEPLTVASLLNSLGLGKYAVIFQVEEVDMIALKQMGDTDLKQLGIPMGPRKKILLALHPRPKEQHPLLLRAAQ